MTTIRATLLALFLLFLGLGVVYGQPGITQINITCRDQETNLIHVRWVGSPFDFGGSLEITETGLGGDLVLRCGME